ncbi:MAG: CoA transferase [Sphingomonas sp.]|uniref:CaiB/BaiF CoA transferase family protein n=1 Tax=Sphingomonas sp. TaxID=28214 RepID=UPI00260E4F39|nr:CoA transferase [Sphingomonas sp.]MDK2766094.1 CoA transferase [Sphingomonas sp.]
MTEASGSLDGLKVIDISRVLAGPYCSMMLADHGADVIKVEPPAGDETRQWGPPFDDHEDARGDASYFIGINRNKRSIALDLSTEAGRDVLMGLLADADVLIENFKPGTMQKWGIGYEQLSERFPGLIYCRISGFGAEGAFGGLPGYDAVLQAMTGLMSINGTASTGATRLATPMVDIATGLFSAIAILMALVERYRSGSGQLIDMALYDCGMALLHPQGANYLLNGIRPKPLGNTHPNLAPCDKFRTRTSEVFIAIGNDRQFARLCDTLGVPEMAKDPRFSRNADRMKNRVAMTAQLESAFAPTDGKELARKLLEAGVPAGPILQIDEALAAPHTHDRGMLIDRPGYRGIGSPLKLSRTPSRVRRNPPRLGEHAAEILSEHGLSAADPKIT